MEDEEITGLIIKAFYNVYNELGFGFLEKVYEKAMCLEFGRIGLKYANQYPVKVYYRGDVVADYFADFLVEGRVVVEIKANRELSSSDEKQLLNYLKSTDREVGLVLNFGKEPEISRKVFDNDLKKCCNNKE